MEGKVFEPRRKKEDRRAGYDRKRKSSRNSVTKRLSGNFSVTFSA
jgi:hypothetical protein